MSYLASIGSREECIIPPMEGFRALRSLRRTSVDTFRGMLGQRFFRDRLSMTVLTLALFVNAATIFSLSLSVRPVDGPVPVHFSSFVMFDELGPWYYPFQIAAVALVLTVINTIFSYHSFSRSRLASFFLLVAALIVGIFCFIIAQAFGAVR